MADFPDSIDVTPSAFSSGGSSGGLFGASTSQVGAGLSAAGELFGGIGDFMSGEASASQLKFQQRAVEQSTALQLLMQRRQAYQLQSRAQAEIGANGLAGGGSADEILRMNAQNLALDSGIIQYQGGLKAGALGTQARAAETAAWGGLAGSLLGAAAKVAVMA